jgi:hypothetical protein
MSDVLSSIASRFDRPPTCAWCEAADGGHTTATSHPTTSAAPSDPRLFAADINQPTLL